MKRAVTLSLLCLVPAAFAQQRPAEASAKSPMELGQPLDGNLTVIDLTGRKRSIQALLARITVINFFSIEADSQRASDQRFAELQQQFADQEVRFLHLNSNVREVGLRLQKPAPDERAPKPYARLHKHLAKHQLSFEVFVDHRNKVADALGARTTPHVFVFDGNHKLIYRGIADDKLHNHVHDTVHKLLANQAVEPFETKPIGAPISRADHGARGAMHTIVPDDDALAVKTARRERKLVLYNFSGFNCSSSRIMEERTFKQAAVKALLRAHVVEARLHTDVQNHMTAKQFARNRKLQEDLASNMANPFYVVVDPATDKVLGRFQLSGKFSKWSEKTTTFLKQVAAKAGRPVR